MLAIRERNFRRIEETVIGAQKVGTVILDPLVEATGEPDAALGEEEERETLNTTILSMVQKRIELLREFGSDLLPKKLVAEGEQPARATSQPFLDQFLTQYQQVLWGMLGTGYYHLSNHCLRTLLPLIGHQVFRVLFGPEADYYQSIAPDPAQQSDAGLRGGEKQTKRNSFYYKMMLTPDRCVPRFDQRIPNVFHSGYNRLRSPLCLRLSPTTVAT